MKSLLPLIQDNLKKKIIRQQLQIESSPQIGIFGNQTLKEQQNLNQIIKKCINENSNLTEEQIIQQSFYIFIKNLDQAQLEKISLQFAQNWADQKLQENKNKQIKTKEDNIFDKKKLQNQLLLQKLKQIQDKYYIKDEVLLEKLNKYILDKNNQEMNMNNDQSSKNVNDNIMDVDKEVENNQKEKICTLVLHQNETQNAQKIQQILQNEVVQDINEQTDDNAQQELLVYQQVIQEIQQQDEIVQNQVSLQLRKCNTSKIPQKNSIEQIIRYQTIKNNFDFPKSLTPKFQIKIVQQNKIIDTEILGAKLYDKLKITEKKKQSFEKVIDEYSNKMKQTNSQNQNLKDYQFINHEQEQNAQMQDLQIQNELKKQNSVKKNSYQFDDTAKQLQEIFEKTIAPSQSLQNLSTQKSQMRQQKSSFKQNYDYYFNAQSKNQEQKDQKQEIQASKLKYLNQKQTVIQFNSNQDLQFINGNQVLCASKNKSQIFKNSINNQFQDNDLQRQNQNDIYLSQRVLNIQNCVPLFQNSRRQKNIKKHS